MHLAEALPVQSEARQGLLQESHAIGITHDVAPAQPVSQLGGEPVLIHRNFVPTVSVYVVHRIEQCSGLRKRKW